MQETEILEEVQRLFASAQARAGVGDVDPDRFPTIPSLLDWACERFADRPAFTSLGHTLSYRDLDKLSRAFAAWLQQETDLEPGDRIAVQMPNLIQYPVVVFGALRAGLVVVNTNPLYSGRELKHQFGDAGVKALVVQANVAETVATVLAESPLPLVVTTEIADLHPPLKGRLINFVVRHVKKLVPKVTLPNAVTLKHALKRGRSLAFTPVPAESDQLAMLQYTGGTTGVAKGAMLSHANLVINAQQVDAVYETYGLTDDENVMVQPLPVYHIYAFMTCTHRMLRGGHMVFIPNPRDLPSVVATMRRYPPHIFCGLNTLFVALCNNEDFCRLDFSRLKLTLSGGMALTQAAANRWESVTGCPVFEGYGLTETSPVLSTNPGTDNVIGTIGLPVPRTEIKIVDEQGAPLPVGEVGELCARGPQVMLGYWQRPEDTAEVLDAEGWFRTGDMARILDDGHLQIVDRKKDMIVVSGFNVYPNEIEDVVAEHPDVIECAAIGVPSDQTGEAVKLFVVCRRDGLTAEDLREFCRQGLTGYKVPRHIEFRDELPKTNVGKILRRALRD